MTSCECGCDQECVREFLPGHDPKLRIQLESRVGGLLLRALVDAAESYAHGESSDDAFTQRVQSVFAVAGMKEGMEDAKED